MHPDFGGDSGDPASPIYGMPYLTVAGSQPLVPVAFDYADESDPGAPGRPFGYPIPEEAKTQQKWIEGGLAGDDPSADGDRHMLIVADNGIDMYVSGTYDTRWDNDALNPAFGAIKASDFEVVQLGWRPSSLRSRAVRH